MRHASGFTLVELAVALAIIGLLLGMLIVPLNAQIDQQRINDTQKHLNLLSEAIVGFAVAHGRLPCPANPTIANTTAGAGLESRTGTACTAALNGQGAIPWVTLGVPEADAWGHRVTYRVTVALADDPTGGLQASFTLATTVGNTGDITVTSGGAAPVNLIANAAVVLVSHGKNGLGAYRMDGTQVAGASGDELENADIDAAFVSKIAEPAFDDIVAWISPNVLKSRMVAANRLP
jgi:prepilin-type N-terminal cleavage/methylation domain-containing protein